MNKLEEIHYENGVNDLEYAPYAAEITTDVAVKFAEFIKENYSFYLSLEKDCLLWENDNSAEKFTSQELFEEFVNNHYRITL